VQTPDPELLQNFLPHAGPSAKKHLPQYQSDDGLSIALSPHPALWQKYFPLPGWAAE